MTPQYKEDPSLKIIRTAKKLFGLVGGTNNPNAQYVNVFGSLLKK